LLPLGCAAVVIQTAHFSDRSRQPVWERFALQREQAPSPQQRSIQISGFRRVDLLHQDIRVHRRRAILDRVESELAHPVAV